MRSSSRTVTMMMTTERKYFFILLVFLVCPGKGNLYGQQKDFQTWYELKLNKDLKSGIDLSLEAGQRFENNSMQYDRSLLTLQADYDVTGWLNAELGVRGLLRMNNERRLQPKYRIHTDATLEQPAGEFDLSYRSRLQYGCEEFYDAGNSELESRNRLEAEYHIFGTRIEVSAYLESYHMLSGSPLRRFFRMRYSARIRYMLGFRSELNLRYILEDEFNVSDPLQSHILTVGFSYDL